MDFLFCAVKEKELLDMYFREGNRHYAFNLMVREYQERLYWHIRRIVLVHEDTDDVLQNTFIKAWNGLPKFKRESALYTWLYRIATNEALSYLKRQKKHSSIDEEELLMNRLENDPYFDGDEAYLRFQKAVQRLPEKQRLVFNMKYFEEMKYEQIAEVLGGSIGSLKASYHHAKKKIEEYIAAD